MNRLLESPVIPVDLQQYDDAGIQEAHACLSRLPLGEFMASMPDMERIEGGAGFVDLSPIDDHDRESVVAVSFPYANGWEPHMAYRVAMLQQGLDEPTRVIAFPNNTFTAQAYDLSRQELDMVKGGSFRPMAERRFRVFEALGIEAFHEVGYSQGASVGAAVLQLAVKTGDFEAKPSGLFEWPNGLERPAKVLRKDFTGDGIGLLNRAINETAIAGYSEAQQSRGGLDSARQLIKFAGFGVSTLFNAENRALHNAMAHDTFTQYLGEALSGGCELKVLLAAAGHSKITPTEATSKALALVDRYPDQVRYREVQGYGHEMGDNLMIHTILAKLAVTGTAFR